LICRNKQEEEQLRQFNKYMEYCKSFNKAKFCRGCYREINCFPSEYSDIRFFCNKYILYKKLYINFNGLKIYGKEWFPAHGTFNPDTEIIMINLHSHFKHHNNRIINTLTHEITHVIVYKILKRLGYTQKECSYGCGLGEKE